MYLFIIPMGKASHEIPCKSIPTEAGNKSTTQPGFLSNIERFMKDLKAEAAYFMEMDGKRTALFFVNVEGEHQIVPISEPFFQMGAEVKYHPAMTFDQLKKGFAAAGIPG